MLDDAEIVITRMVPAARELPDRELGTKRGIKVGLSGWSRLAVPYEQVKKVIANAKPS